MSYFVILCRKIINVYFLPKRKANYTSLFGKRCAMTQDFNLLIESYFNPSWTLLILVPLPIALVEKIYPVLGESIFKRSISFSVQQGQCNFNDERIWPVFRHSCNAYTGRILLLSFPPSDGKYSSNIFAIIWRCSCLDWCCCPLFSKQQWAFPFWHQSFPKNASKF